MGIQVSPELESRLKALTAKTGHSPERLLEEAVRGYETTRFAALDWTECPVVERVPGKVSGAWVLRGTRMPVATIFENLEAGASLDDLLQWYEGLDRDQVKAVIAFAARSLDMPAPGR